MVTTRLSELMMSQSFGWCIWIQKISKISREASGAQIERGRLAESRLEHRPDKGIANETMKAWRNWW